MVRVRPTRLVVSQGKACGCIDKPPATGDLIAIDFDGKHQEYPDGFNQVGQRATVRENDRGFGSVDSLPTEPNGHFCMSATPRANKNPSTLHDVDAVNNTRHLSAEMSRHGMSFLANPQGKVAFACGMGPDAVQEPRGTCPAGGLRRRRQIQLRLRQ